MLNKFKIKIKKNTEIIALSLLIIITIIFLRKFDAYRLKLREIKHLRIKKMIKTPYFARFFFDFCKILN